MDRCVCGRQLIFETGTYLEDELAPCSCGRLWQVEVSPEAPPRLGAQYADEHDLRCWGYVRNQWRYGPFSQKRNAETSAFHSASILGRVFRSQSIVHVEWPDLSQLISLAVDMDHVLARLEEMAGSEGYGNGDPVIDIPEDVREMAGNELLEMMSSWAERWLNVTEQSFRLQGHDPDSDWAPRAYPRGAYCHSCQKRTLHEFAPFEDAGPHWRCRHCRSIFGD